VRYGHGLRSRQLYDELSTGIRCAEQFDRATVLFGEALRKRQAEAAAVGPRRCAPAIARLEDVLPIRRRNTRSAVGYRQYQRPVRALTIDLDAASGRRVADRIRYDVVYDLGYPDRVAGERTAGFAGPFALVDVERDATLTGRCFGPRTSLVITAHTSIACMLVANVAVAVSCRSWPRSTSTSASAWSTAPRRAGEASKTPSRNASTFATAIARWFFIS